jgi:hypothetical protein
VKAPLFQTHSIMPTNESLPDQTAALTLAPEEHPDQVTYTITIQVTDAKIWEIIKQTGYKPYVSTSHLKFNNEQWDAELVSQQEADDVG